tara:strand:+ start:45 stop:938 length:894 start_codon:yes stop_codon:yes gene_type:complete
MALFDDSKDAVSTFTDDTVGSVRGFFGGATARFADQTNELANRGGQQIEFMHIATGKVVSFKAFLTAFADNYRSNWKGEEGYGRMDNIQIFKNTSRSITLGFSVPAASVKESINNMKNLSTLTQMLYPTFDVGTDQFGAAARTIKASPLWKVKFMNWIQDSKDGSGLLVACKGFSFAPRLADGAFHRGNNIYAKAFDISVTLDVIHEHALGWEKGKSSRQGKSVDDNKTTVTQNQTQFGPVEGNKKFPYGEKVVPKTTALPETPAQKNKQSNIKASNQAQIVSNASALRGTGRMGEH